jgi:hypothetical protein
MSKKNTDLFILLYIITNLATEVKRFTSSPTLLTHYLQLTLQIGYYA